MLKAVLSVKRLVTHHRYQVPSGSWCENLSRNAVRMSLKRLNLQISYLDLSRDYMLGWAGV